MVVQVKKSEFLSLVETNQDIIHKICNLYGHNQEDRRDLSQEIVCQLWKSYPRFRGEAKFTTWMYRVALNTALLNLRHLKQLKQTESLKTHHGVVMEAATPTAKTESINNLYTAIGQLREFDRAIIMLWLEELPYQEIAEITGITESNVSVRLVRIKKKLKELLEQGARE